MTIPPRFVPRPEHLEDRSTPAALQAVGAGVGGEPLVKLVNADGSEVSRVLAFEAGFTGGVRVATGDVNADGTADVIAGSGPGRAAEIRVFDGVTGAELFRAQPFDGFTGGVFVAAGDIDRDGLADVAVSPDQGGGPRVRVYAGGGFGQMANVFGIEDPGFRGGVRVAIGDLTADGRGDLVVAAGTGGGPRVSAWDGRALAAGEMRHPFGDRFVFPDVLRNGVFVAVGDLDGDGFGDLVAGAGPGGGPHVLALSGKDLLGGAVVPRANFFAGADSERNGVPVAVADLDGDNRADLLTGTGQGSGSRTRAFLGKDIRPEGTPPLFRDLDAFPGTAGGAFVGGSDPALTIRTAGQRSGPMVAGPTGPPGASSASDVPPPERVVVVSTTDEFRAAVNAATPGTHILLNPGEYQGGSWFGNVRGQAGRPILIGAADPNQRPVIRGGREGMQFSDAAYLEVRDLVFDGQTDDGINVDDYGSFDTPSHHITLRNLWVRNTGSGGNQDGIKLSGVDRFLVTGCLIEGWGSGGSGVDMVGCHDGVIEGSLIRNGGGTWGNGVQAKGGSARVVVRGSRFENAGVRAVQAGGSSDLSVFRPQGANYEAQDITVEGNVIIGSETAVAFVGVDGATVRFNTIYRPGRWPLRILQETWAPGFVPSRNGVFTDNLIVFHAADVATTVNVGAGTAPQSFQFARNWWFAADNPGASVPTLPTAETAGVYGVDPQLVNPAGGDLRPAAGSPAAGYGAYAMPW